MNKLAKFIRKIIFKIDDRPMLEILKENGLTVGERFNLLDQCIIDPGH